MDLTSSPGHLNHQFVAEDAATLRAATEITPNDMNAPMNELVNIILAAQIAPNSNNHTQVLAALQALFLKRDGDTGVIRTITPAGGARVRELGDIANAATVGGIEIGTSYNCNIDPVTGAWSGRDVADLCWLEKWSDAGGLKEFWFAPTAAAGAAPAFVLIEQTDLINAVKTFNGKLAINTATAANHAVRASQIVVNSVSPASMVRLNSANGYGSINTCIRRFLNIVTNQGSDITYADSATLGASFTINTSGVYAVSYSDNFGSIADFGISLNSAQLAANINSITAADRLCIGSTQAANYSDSVSIELYLPEGSVIRPHADSSANSSTSARSQFTITRIS